ncbi:ABC transporter substrate-binding protein [Streptomyces sp. NPDC048172]|uniref:ABC transporter substrate-binding protein n=1 Tax=Streptomyces sp. NPDC048172 TaxID=3365505 RepID=UPI003718D9BB
MTSVSDPHSVPAQAASGRSARPDARPAPGVGRVGADGSFERLDAGGSDLVLDATVRRWARLMLLTRRPAASFVWITGSGRWAQVDLVVPPTGADSPAAVTFSVAEVDPPYGLTVRELDVLTLLAGGLTNASVAGYLGTSSRTVGKQVEALLEKLGQPSRGAAAAFAVDTGLLRLPVPGGCAELSALTLGMLDALDHGQGRPPRFAGAPKAPDRRFAPRPLAVGLVAPSLGPYGADGEEMRAGAELAVAELNARGGVGGRPVDLEVFALDNRDPDSVDTAFAAAGEGELAALLGGYLLTDERRTYEYAAELGIPYLHLGTSDLQASWVAAEPNRFGNVFQTGPRRSNYLPGFLRFAADTARTGDWRPRRRTLAVVETAFPDSEILPPGAADLLESAGWQIDFRLRVGPASDWDAVLAEVRRTEPAALLLGNHPPAAVARFQRAFVRDPSPTLLYNLLTPSVPAFLTAAGTAAEGVVWASATGRYGDERGAAFARDFLRRHGRKPGHALASAAYDQVRMLAQAWTVADAPRRPGATMAALRNEVHRGVNGSYYLGGPGQTNAAYPDENPDPSLAQAPLVFQIQRGVSRTIHPAPYAETVFRRPPWLRDS